MQINYITLHYRSLRATLFYNDTIYSVPTELDCVVKGNIVWANHSNILFSHSLCLKCRKKVGTLTDTERGKPADDVQM